MLTLILIALGIDVIVSLSTIGFCSFMGDSLIYGNSKKHVVACFSIEVEYIEL